jgi:hypothetical protein
MLTLREQRGELEEKYDHLMLSKEEIDLTVEQFIWNVGRGGFDPEDILAEAEILQKTLVRSSLYNYKHSHLRIVD